MAKVSPYFDPRAHGSLSDALTFRVFRGTTRLGKKNRPRDPHSVGQLAQRTIFKAASNAYNQLNEQWRTFLYDRAVSINSRGREVFMRAHMKDTLPSTTPGIPMDALQNMVIFNAAGIESQSIKLSIFRPPLEDYCLLWNKHQNASLISEVGPNGVNGGATFVPGKWDNCARIDAVGEQVSYSGLLPALDPNSFIYSWWMYTDYEVIDGQPQDSNFHTAYHMGFNTVAGGKYNMMGIFPNAHGVFISDDTSYKIENITIDWPAATWKKFLMVRDRAANFDGDKTIALYADGVEIGSTNVALAAYDTPTADIFRIGAQANPNVPLLGNVDNPKLFGPVSAKLLDDALANQDTEELAVAELMGSTYDSENIFTPVEPTVEGPAHIITIENNLGNPERIPMDYLVVLHWFREPDDYGTTKVRLPKLNMPGYGGVTLYISTDGSVYWDEAMTQIACTPKMYYART